MPTNHEKIVSLLDSMKETIANRSDLEMLLAISLGKVYADLTPVGQREFEYFTIAKKAVGQG